MGKKEIIKNKEIEESIRKKLDKWFYEQILPYSTTTGTKKMWNYFSEIVKSEYFQNKIKQIRQKYKIPKDGLKTLDRCPTPFHSKYKPIYAELHKKIYDEVKNLCIKYHLSYVDWYGIIEGYILFNKEILPAINPYFFNLCYVRNLPREKARIIKNKDYFSENDFRENYDMLYPVAVMISPYASLRDILNYIKIAYKIDIKPLQEKYKDKNVKIGKIKSKKQSIQKRNQFIYENRNLPRKKIKELVKKEFNEVLDYEYVGKIISEIKKSRKEL